jgi:predicted nucleic-acid-binding Zn-ribbon protein
MTPAASAQEGKRSCPPTRNHRGPGLAPRTISWDVARAKGVKVEAHWAGKTSYALLVNAQDVYEHYPSVKPLFVQCVDATYQPVRDMASQPGAMMNAPLVTSAAIMHDVQGPDSCSKGGNTIYIQEPVMVAGRSFRAGMHLPKVRYGSSTCSKCAA